LLASVGIASRGPFLLITETLFIAAALLAIYAGWMQLRTRSRVDRVKALYERFCRRTARLGVRRSPWEGPSDFSRRAAQLLPNESERIRQISNTYITLRYSPESSAAICNQFAKEVNQFGEHARW
jgi:protein-glutamine gamma-glutamyltransferase